MQFKQYFNAVPQFLIDVQYLLSHDTSRAKLMAKKGVTRHVNRRNYHCSDDTNLKTFASCVFEMLFKLTNGSCNPVIPSLGLTLAQSNICKSTKALKDSYGFLKGRLIEMLTSKGQTSCKIPCKKVSYEAELQFVHRNAKLLLNKENELKEELENIFVGMEFQDFYVRYNDEYLILDVNGLVSAVGGFLGLFLGHCALSQVDRIYAFLKQKIN